jgi:hypothetical protein
MVHRRTSSRWLISIVAVVAAMAIVAVVALASGTGGDTGSSASAKISVKRAQLVDPRTPGRVLFVSDFESQGFPEWYVQALPGRASLVHGHAYEGRSNARFEVRPGDVEPDTGSQRAEVSGPTYHEGQDLYVRTAFRVPAANSFHGNWQLIQQFHEDNWGGSPGTAVFLTPDRHFEIGHGDSSQIDWRSPKIKDNHWYELVYRVKFSRDPKVGFVEVWLDGHHQKLTNGHYRRYGFTMQQPHSYLKTGIYRSSTSTGISLMEDDSTIVVEAPH